MKLDCLDKILGLSENPCFENVEGFEECNVSISGQYALSDKYIPLLDPCCDPQKYFELLKKAKAQGISDLLRDLMHGLGKTTSKNLSTYCSTFGKPSNNSPMVGCVGDYVGFYFESKQQKGTIVKLSERIGLQINGPIQDYTVGLYCADDGFTTPLETVVITTGNGNIAYVPIDWTVQGDKQYQIKYDRQGNRPYDIKFDCGCSASNIAEYAHYMKYGGVADKSCDNYTNGLIVDFCLCCNPLDFLCQQSEWWWCNTDFGLYFTMVMQGYITRCFNALINKEKGLIGRNINKEEIKFAQMALGRTLPKHIKELCSTFPFELTDCIKCLESQKLKVKSNLL